MFNGALTSSNQRKRSFGATQDPSAPAAPAGQAQPPAQRADIDRLQPTGGASKVARIGDAVPGSPRPEAPETHSASANQPDVRSEVPPAPESAETWALPALPQAERKLPRPRLSTFVDLAFWIGKTSRSSAGSERVRVGVEGDSIGNVGKARVAGEGLDLTALRSRLIDAGYGSALRKALLDVARHYPAPFQADAPALPAAMTIGSVESIARAFAKGINIESIREFLDARFVDLVTKVDGYTAPRHELIFDALQSQPSNRDVLNLLKDERWRSVIFPERSVTQFGVKRLCTALAVARAGGASMHESLSQILPLVTQGNPENVALSLAVATKQGLAWNRQNFAKLSKKRPEALATELMDATVATADKPFVKEMVVAVAKRTMHSKKTASRIRTLVFFAENAAAVSTMAGYAQRVGTDTFAHGLARLIEQHERDQLDTYADMVALAATDPVARQFAGNPGMVGKLTTVECDLTWELLEQHRSGEIQCFRQSKIGTDSLKLLCDVMRLKAVEGPVMARNAEDRRRVSAARHVNQLLYEAFTAPAPDWGRQGFNFDLVALIHADLWQLTEATERAQNGRIAEQVRLVPHALAHNQPIRALETVTTHLWLRGNVDLFNQLLRHETEGWFRLAVSGGPPMRKFVLSKHDDIFTLSENARAALIRVFVHWFHTGTPIEQGLALLEDKWARVMEHPDTVRAQLFESLLRVQVAQRRRRAAPAARANPTGIHGARTTRMVAATAKALIGAYKRAGFDQTVGQDTGGARHIEPIPADLLNEALREFEAALEADMIARAGGGASEGGANGAQTLENARKILETEYDALRKRAREIERLRTEIARCWTAGASPESISAQEVNLRKLEQENKVATAATAPYGALKYLESRHLESSPKAILGSDLPGMTMRQIFGMALLLPRLDESVARWHVGLDTVEKRREAVHERLVEALHDSHIAYLGTRHDDNISCWDGGTNRILLAVRLLIDFDIMPNPSDFGLEFRNAVTSVLEWLSTQAVLQSTDAGLQQLRGRVRALMASSAVEQEGATVSSALARVIMPWVLRELKRVFPQIKASAENVQTAKAMLREIFPEAQYIELPRRFVEAYTST